MKKIVFTLMIMLSIILQPFRIQAAYIDLDGKEHLKQGNYVYVERDRMPLGDSRKWIQSGYYHYEFLDSKKTYITIRRIASKALEDGKLTIPETIDGHMVLGTGMFWDESYYDGNPTMLNKEQMCILDEPQKLKELMIPYSVEFLGHGSFYQCEKLEKISYYNNNGGESRLVRIETDAFGATHNIKEIVFPPGVSVKKSAFSCWDSGIQHECHLKKITMYTDNVVSCGNWFPQGEKAELYIRKHDYSFYSLTVPGNLNKLYVDKELSLFQLKMAYDENWDDDDPPMHNRTVNKLVMNGKETVLWLPEEINEVFPTGGLKGLYTVKGAICIREAKKYRIPVYWKTSGKAKEIKVKKKSGQYQVSWKKIKSIVHKQEYKTEKKKWKVTKSPIQTVYKVYGKKEKMAATNLLKLQKRGVLNQSTSTLK